MRFKPQPCSLDRSAKNEFRSNDRFTPTSGGEFWSTSGELAFTANDPHFCNQDNSYRTGFGPCVGHNGVVYCKCDGCVKLAFRRLTQRREPTHQRLLQAVEDGFDPDEFTDSYDEMLRQKQVDFWKENEHIIATLKGMYSTHFEEWEGIEEEALQHHSDPHIKRILRIQAWLELNENGNRHKRMWLTKVLYKLKCDEIAKAGKVPRMIGDLGVAASLQGFRLTKHLKEAQECQPWHVNGGEIAFCSSPNPSELNTVFSKLINPPERFFMVYYSDDSCFAFRHRGVVRFYNLDISKCDASHGPSLFESLVGIIPDRLQEEMQILVDQCKLPIVINSENGLRERVRGVFKDPTLYSGSTITTAINNLANISVGYALSSVVFEDRDYTDAEFQKIFTLAIEETGYIVTGFADDEKCVIPEDLQFLKHSPCLDETGCFQAMKNLGVLLRASGTCKGDLPGSKKTDIVTRAREFQAALLHGMYPDSSFPFLSNMKEAAGHATNARAVEMVADELRYKVGLRDEHIRFSDDDVFRRYRLDASELADLRDFSHAGVFEHCSNSFVTKILEKDYGLKALCWPGVA